MDPALLKLKGSSSQMMASLKHSATHAVNAVMDGVGMGVNGMTGGMNGAGATMAGGHAGISTGGAEVVESVRA